MRREELYQIKVIDENNAAIFEKKVNECLRQLANEDITPEKPIFNPNKFRAIILYKQTEYIAQNENDREALKGRKVVCKNCDYYEKGIDYRIGFCNLKDKQVYAERFACKYIKDGEKNV